MRLLPEDRRNGKGINALALPPGAFIAAPMELTMMQPAQRHSELVADLAAQRAGFRKFEVVSIGGAPSTDEAALAGNKLEMVAIALAYRFANDEKSIGAGRVLFLIAVNRAGLRALG
jgi:hypothetical protein